VSSGRLLNAECLRGREGVRGFFGEVDIPYLSPVDVASIAPSSRDGTRSGEYIISFRRKREKKKWRRKKKFSPKGKRGKKEKREKEKREKERKRKERKRKKKKRERKRKVGVSPWFFSRSTTRQEK
jgi:hypothetical protein